MALSLIHIFGINMTKLSAALFTMDRCYKTIRHCLLYTFIGTSKPLQNVMCALTFLAVLIVTMMVWFSCTMLQCTPVAAAWDPSLESISRCMSISVYATSYTVNNGKSTILTRYHMLLTNANSYRLCDRSRDCNPHTTSGLQKSLDCCDSVVATGRSMPVAHRQCSSNDPHAEFAQPTISWFRLDRERYRKHDVEYH